MKVIVEMKFYVAGSHMKCFSEVEVPHNYKPVRIGIQEVLKKHRENSHPLKVVEVKVADKNVTEDVIKYEREYLKRRVMQLDDMLPF